MLTDWLPLKEKNQLNDLFSVIPGFDWQLRPLMTNAKLKFDLKKKTIGFSHPSTNQALTLLSF